MTLDHPDALGQTACAGGGKRTSRSPKARSPFCNRAACRRSPAVKGHSRMLTCATPALPADALVGDKRTLAVSQAVGKESIERQVKSDSQRASPSVIGRRSTLGLSAYTHGHGMPNQ